MLTNDQIRELRKELQQGENQLRKGVAECLAVAQRLHDAGVRVTGKEIEILCRRIIVINAEIEMAGEVVEAISRPPDALV